MNNAGIAWPGALHEVDDEVHRRVIETNLLGPVFTSRRVVQSLLARGAPGDLVFISSDVTVNARPKMPAYGASKAGLEHLAHTLSLELEGTGIRSGVVRVGPTLTSFGDGWDMAIFESLLPEWQRYGLQRHWNTMDVANVARAVVMMVDIGARHGGTPRRAPAHAPARYLIAVGATGAPTACVSGSGVAHSRKSY